MKSEFSFLGFLGGILLSMILASFLYWISDLDFLTCFIAGLFGVIINGFLFS